MDKQPKLHNTAFTVAREAQDSTLQDFLASKLNISNRAAKNIIDQRQVWVNRKCVWMARHVLKCGDVVEARAAIAAQKAVPKHLRILVDTDDYFFLDKPYGMLSIGENGAEETIRRQLGNSEIRAVHRLDKDTSGCMLFAKSQEAFDAVVPLFKTRRVKKLYGFLAVGRIENNPTTITDPIDGEAAKTTIRRISANDDATFGSARIETGRTHQIRIHLASIRHPIVGDRLHGLKKSPDRRYMYVPRQMLHATEIELDNPMGRGRLRAHSPLPADFRRCLQLFKL